MSELWKLTDSTGVYVRPKEYPDPFWKVAEFEGCDVYLVSRLNLGIDMSSRSRLYNIIEKAKKEAKP
jgi:hypothetical protein